MKKLDPSIRRAALFEVEREWPEVAREFEATHMSPLYSLVTKERVRGRIPAGLEVVPWTVNKPEDWAKTGGRWRGRNYLGRPGSS